MKRLEPTPDLLRRLLRVKDAMDRASHQPWTVVQLARLGGVSPAHFARSFKAAFGVPPHRYLLTRRMERACALLRETALPITEIAYQTGWESLGTFGRIFRDVTGASPGEFRGARQGERPELAWMPECFVNASNRPPLTIAVLEKRRRAAAATNEPPTTDQEVS
jgi:transcriptional regulator GlxA family with amidase domain